MPCHLVSVNPVLTWRKTFELYQSYPVDCFFPPNCTCSSHVTNQRLSCFLLHSPPFICYEWACMPLCPPPKRRQFMSAAAAGNKKGGLHAPLCDLDSLSSLPTSSSPASCRARSSLHLTMVLLLFYPCTQTQAKANISGPFQVHVEWTTTEISHLTVLLYKLQGFVRSTFVQRFV